MKKKVLQILALLLTAVTQGAWADDGIYCTASDVGRVVCTDGSIYDNVSAAEADGKTAVAMIAYLDTENNKGLALALADETNGSYDDMVWTTAINTCSAKNTSLAVTGASWKLATRDEWNTMISAAGSYTALRDVFSSVGGTNMQTKYDYWSSSTLDDSSYAWSYDFYYGYWSSSYIPNVPGYVRACLAFDFTASVMADEWDVVYRQTQTKQSDWTALGAGSTTGRTLGSANAMTYYYATYATGDLCFTNSTAGGSGLTIQGTVYLYIPSGKTLTCTGADASGQTGAGAGIELTAGNTLYVVGSGTLNATGGNAANGGNGANGGDSFLDYDNNKLYSGTGGTGGNGGGGAGAGIGTRGGNGGTGGTGGERHTREGSGSWDPANGNNGSAGTAGTTAGAMGNLYVVTSFAHLSATGGQAGSNGSGGNSGWSALWDGANNWSAPGGGGGGAGGFGGAASNIGTGGPGGGGGGGGAGGCLDWKQSGYYYYYAVGGSGGTNANGSSAPDGQTAEVSPTALANGKCGTNGSFDSDDVSYESSAVSNGSGGAGGDSGHASSNGSAVNLVLWPTQGAGTEESPYLISSADDWNTFVTNVNNGISFSGKVIKLTDDISVTTMAGSYQDDDNYQPFSGTFDGGGYTLTINVSNQSRFAAPFKCVSGATIRNLHTTGTIDGTGNSDGKLLAGLIGVSFGNTTITGCRSSMTLTTDFGEDAAMAGLVAGTKGGSLTIEGCVFDGEMLGSANTRCAGIAGYEYGGTTTTISNCLFIPATLTVSTADDSYTKTFTRDDDATIDNCYYTKVLGAAQGTAANVTDQTPTNPDYDYGMVKAYKNGIWFDGNFYGTPATVTLADDADNGTTISNADGCVADVTLSGRTLYKDGAWNTLCLPFDVALDGSPLEDAVARPLESASISGATLSLTFGNPVDELVAGTPYIIKWTKADDYVDDNEHNLVNPVFHGVTIDKTERNYDNKVSGDKRVRFMGTYKSTTFDAEDKSILLMGGGNTLYWPQSGASIGAQRAYFKLGEGGTYGARITSFSIGFGDDDNTTTGIIEAEANSSLYPLPSTVAEGWYDMQGRKIDNDKLSNGKMPRGVYIHNGRKVVVK